MWPSSQHPIRWMLTSRIIIILFFFTFWLNQMIFPFWDGPWSGPWRQCLTFHTISYFFLFFFVSIWLFFDRLPYLEMDPGPCKCFSTSSPTMGTIPQFFLIFWVFCSYFWIDYHIGHWTLNSENVTNHHHHHPPIFSDFLAIFWLFLDRLLYLDLDPGPWTLQTLHTIIPTIPHFFFYFSAILLPFFIQISAHFHIWKCALDPDNSTPSSSLTVSTIPLFFLKISLFYCYYSFGKAHISIFGSALLDPENSEQAMSNSEQAVGNSEHQGWPQGAQQWALY